MHLGAGVLSHHEAVFVVEVGDYEGVFGEGVEEGLLGAQVVVYGLMVVHVVACEVGEDTSGKLKASDTALRYGVGAHLHENILAAFVGHASQQSIEGDGIGCSVLGRDGFAVDIVAHGGDEAYLISHGAEHIVEEGGDGGLAIGSCDAYESHLVGGVVMECCSYGAYGLFAIGNAQVGDPFGQCGGKLLAEDGCGPLVDGALDILVPVDLCAAHGYEQVTLADAARVDVYVGNGALGVAYGLFDAYLFDNL